MNYRDSRRSVPSGCRYAGTGQSAGCFTDHMVLQQKVKCPWGSARYNQSCRKLGSAGYGNDCRPFDGTWGYHPENDRGGRSSYLISILGDGTRELKDVMLGEVWLCSGQSNMEWTPMHGIDNSEEDYVAAANYPNIRFFHIPKRGLQPRRIIRGSIVGTLYP